VESLEGHLFRVGPGFGRRVGHPGVDDDPSGYPQQAAHEWRGVRHVELEAIERTGEQEAHGIERLGVDCLTIRQLFGELGPQIGGVHTPGYYSTRAWVWI